MEVFRISREKYSKSIVASGRAGCWNKDEQFVLYTSSQRSLATLELMVHKDDVDVAFVYKIMILYLADEESLYSRFFLKEMPENWRDSAAPSFLKDIGSDWYEHRKSLILQVPSVVVPQEHNFLINIKHPDFSNKTCKLLKTEEFF
jgi:RES domain-containing protein